MPVDWVVIGLDNGGTSNSGTVLDASGRFLLGQMAEVPSDVREGPERALLRLVESVQQVLGLTGVPLASVRAVGLDTPGPASADGVISSKGATNFGHAASLYAHHARFGEESAQHGSVAAIVGTGLGGGIVEAGQVVKGAAG